MVLPCKVRETYIVVFLLVVVIVDNPFAGSSLCITATMSCSSKVVVAYELTAVIGITMLLVLGMQQQCVDCSTKQKFFLKAAVTSYHWQTCVSEVNKALVSIVHFTVLN